MEFREMTFFEAEAVIGNWRKEGVEEIEPGVEICDCGGYLEPQDSVIGAYSNDHYIGFISGVLSECDRCKRRFFAYTEGHFCLD